MLGNVAQDLKEMPYTAFRIELTIFLSIVSDQWKFILLTNGSESDARRL